MFSSVAEPGPSDGRSSTDRSHVANASGRNGRAIPTNSVAPGQPLPGVREAVWGLAAAIETFDSPFRWTSRPGPMAWS